MKILFAGDWHAGTDHASRVVDLAAGAGFSRVVQVGDFGFWPRFEEGRRYLEAVSAHAKAAGVEVWFCDGNHDDHDGLPHDTATHPLELLPGIVWVPRGVTVEWADRRLLFFGGAVSVDQDSRTAGWTWFANEIPSEEAWERAMAAGPVDVVVAHDTVPGMPVRGLPPLSIPWSARRRAGEHRKRLRALQAAIAPRLWVHGHFHQRATALLDGTRFESLGHDRGPLEESILACDLATLETWQP